MVYNLDDLKNGKVILENDNSIKTSKILNKVFNDKINLKEERAGYNHYFALSACNPNVYDSSLLEVQKYGCCDNVDLTDQSYWLLHLDGTRKLPDYLKGFKTTFECYGIDNLPLQKASKFKLK